MKGFPLKTLKKDMHALVLVIGACLPVLLSSPVFAQDVQSRINRLENEIETLSRAVFKGEQPPEGYSVMGGDLNADAAAQANIEVRLSQLENEIRSITGRLEEITHQNRQFQTRIEKDLADMKLSLEQRNSASKTGSVLGADGQENAYGMPRNIGGNDGDGEGFSPTIDTDPPPIDDAAQEDAYGTQGQLGVLRTTVDGDGNVVEPETVPDDVWPTDPAGLYERAFAYLRDREYGKAAQGFERFLDTYPDHDLAANSKYWLGETFYVRQQYQRAAREFAESYQNYPDGPKGPDNLLKLGMSLAGLGKKEDACLSFAQLETEYPDAPSSIMIRAEAEAEKHNCP